MPGLKLNHVSKRGLWSVNHIRAMDWLECMHSSILSCLRGQGLQSDDELYHKYSYLAKRVFEDETTTCWRHQMATFPLYWPFVRGIHRSPVNSHHKGQWRGALMFPLICAWINRWVNNREAADLRCYDVIVMVFEDKTALCMLSYFFPFRSSLVIL